MDSPVLFSTLMSAAVEPPDLPDGEIHLWASRLDFPAERIETLATALSSDELARAQRFRFQHHRDRFITSWGLTRSLLAAYTDHDARSLKFRYGIKGKPSLADPGGDLEFNISHSRDLVLLGVRRGLQIGVDVEYLRPVDDAREIARRHFSPGEVERLEELSDDEYLVGFFTCWTRKEAMVKALGGGLFLALDRFEVSLAPAEPPRLLTLDGEAGAAEMWSLFHLEPTSATVGAVATEDRHTPRIRAWTLDPERQLLPGLD